LSFVIYYLRQAAGIFSSTFVCLFAELGKHYIQPIFTKFGGNVAHGRRKKQLHFGGNPDLDLNPGFLSREFYRCDIVSGICRLLIAGSAIVRK